MARHQADLVRCARLPGVTAGRVCSAHDGRCVACDSMVRPAALARVCDGCGQRGGGERCVVCRAGGVADAGYCKGCVQMEKDRDGCPAVVNIGAARTDALYERNKYGLIK
ncbi:hypothetical protein ACQ4PT_016247 [Festuca glaucescens]